MWSTGTLWRPALETGISAPRHHFQANQPKAQPCWVQQGIDKSPFQVVWSPPSLRTTRWTGTRWASWPGCSMWSPTTHLTPPMFPFFTPWQGCCLRRVSARKRLIISKHRVLVKTQVHEACCVLLAPPLGLTYVTQSRAGWETLRAALRPLARWPNNPLISGLVNIAQLISLGTNFLSQAVRQQMSFLVRSWVGGGTGSDLIRCESISYNL